MKASRTVWSGGKAGDDIKGLPIAINYAPASFDFEVTQGSLKMQVKNIKDAAGNDIDFADLNLDTSNSVIVFQDAGGNTVSDVTFAELSFDPMGIETVEFSTIVNSAMNNMGTWQDFDITRIVQVEATLDSPDWDPVTDSGVVFPSDLSEAIADAIVSEAANVLTDGGNYTPLLGGNPNKDNVVFNLTDPSTITQAGITVTLSSGNTDIIANDGTVTNPAEPTSVSLQYTISVDPAVGAEQSTTINFSVTVQPLQ